MNQSAVIPKSTSGAKLQIKVHQGFKLSAGSQDYQNYGGDGTARSQGWKGHEALFDQRAWLAGFGLVPSLVRGQSMASL